MCARARHLPLVCRQWRNVLKDSSTAWRVLWLKSKIDDAAKIQSFFAFCVRTRGVEVRLGVLKPADVRRKAIMTQARHHVPLHGSPAPEKSFVRRQTCGHNIDRLSPGPS